MPQKPFVSFFLCLFLAANLWGEPPLTNDTWLPVQDNVQQKVEFTQAFLDREHPRLFFRQEDIPELRARAERAPFKEMISVMKTVANWDFDENNGYEQGTLARVRAFLFVLTEDQTWADRAREAVDNLRRAEGQHGVWYAKNNRQLNLTQGSYSVAIAYDWCYHAWPEDYRREISLELSRQGRMQLHDWGRGFPSRGWANNWRGIRFAGAGIALLASDEPIVEVADMIDLPEDPMNPFHESPGLDPRWFQASYDNLAGYFTSALTAEPGGRGVNSEGQGYMMYPWRLIAPFLIAAENNLQVDIRKDVPATRFNLWQIAYNAVKIPSSDSEFFPGKRNYGVKLDFTNDNPYYVERGEMALAFPYTDPEFLAGYRWHWDQFFGADGAQLYGAEAAGTVWAYLFYPEEVDPVHPDEDWGLGYLDAPTGTIFLRNSFDGESDVLVGLTVRQRGVLQQTHFGADIGSLRIVGEGGFFTTGSGRSTDQEGQSIVVNEASLAEGVSARSSGELEFVRILENGSGSLSLKGSSAKVEAHRRMLMVDFDPDATEGLSAFMLVADKSEDGDLWQLNIPEMKEVELGPRNFTITAPSGARLQGLVHYPANPQLEVTTYQRADGIRFDGEEYAENHRLLLRGPNGETRFLVSFQLLAKDAERTEEVLERTDPQPVFRMGQRRYAVMEDRILVSDWEQEISVQAEVVPAGAGRVVGEQGTVQPGEKVEWSAEAAPGYRFVRWESSRPALGQPLGGHSEVSFLAVDNTSARAIFERE